jgi:hypothetical protein
MSLQVEACVNITLQAAANACVLLATLNIYMRSCRSFLEAYPTSSAAKPFAAVVDGLIQATPDKPTAAA